MIINSFLFVPILPKINEMEYYFCGEIEKLEILIINFFEVYFPFTKGNILNWVSDKNFFFPVDLQRRY